MKSITALAATTACALTLTACGGSGGYDNGSTNDTTGGGNGNNNNSVVTANQDPQGIWIDSSQSVTMQAIVLSDGSYYGAYGPTLANGSFVAHGTFGQGSVYRIKGSSIEINTPSQNAVESGGSGGWSPGVFLTGTISNGRNMSMDFGSSSFISYDYGFSKFNMTYDNIYNQSASLASIAGVYQGVGYDGKTDSLGSKAHRNLLGDISDELMEPPAGRLTIFGSNLTLDDGSCLTGTVAPHGTGGANVFDVTLAVSCDLIEVGAPFQIVDAGTTFKGILFQTSAGYIEIIAPSNYVYNWRNEPGPNNGIPAYFFIGNR